MEDIYSLSDNEIEARVGGRIRETRLRQNITQAALASDSGVSLSSIKNIEAGVIKSFDPFIRVLRTLGLLDLIRELAEPAGMSPNEYYELVNSRKKHTRQRAYARKIKKEEGTEW